MDLKFWACFVFRYSDFEFTCENLKIYQSLVVKTMPLKHTNITVYGEVQGVGFRFSAQKKARELCVCGFARNEPNGAVYLEAEGKDEALSSFIEWCRTGNEFAKVEKIDIEYGEIVGYEGFGIG